MMQVEVILWCFPFSPAHFSLRPIIFAVPPFSQLEVISPIPDSPFARLDVPHVEFPYSFSDDWRDGRFEEPAPPPTTKPPPDAAGNLPPFVDLAVERSRRVLAIDPRTEAGFPASKNFVPFDPFSSHF